MDSATMDNRIVIVSGGDDAFAMPIAVSMFSALVNLPRECRPLIYLFDDGISQTNKDRITTALQLGHPAVEIAWLTPDLSAIEGLSPSPWNTRATYLRLFIPDLLGPEHTRVLYIDSDVIVKRDLSEIWNQSLDGRLALAVGNFTDPTVATGLSNTYQLLGLSPDTPYFNAGILLINVERWRKEQVPARVFTFLREYGPLAPFADQDGLNAVIAGDWGQLHPRWNIQLVTLDTYGQPGQSPEERRYAGEQLLAQAGILHYTGPRKPWHLRYRGHGREAFAHYLGMSRWYNPVVYAAWAASRALSHLGTRQLGRLKGLLNRQRSRPGAATADLGRSL